MAFACSARSEVYLKSFIRSIPDFPIAGIDFKDITPLLADSHGFTLIVESSIAFWRKAHIDAVIAVEARGFLVGAPLAHLLSVGLILVRKPGKLPGERDQFAYTCEYSSGALEVHRGLVKEGMRCLIVDDLLATGGTARATADYVLRSHAVIGGFSFVVELAALKGRLLLNDGPVYSVLQY